tara:strand:+ start:216 stop:911 length:696 start_codon:yes stop_codon:yes gene_type:complete
MIGGIFGSVIDVARDILAPQPQVVVRPEVRTTVPDSQMADIFSETLSTAISAIPRAPEKQEIILKLPEETKESGQMENGPQVYQGAAGALVPFAQQLGRTIFGGGAGGAIGGAIGGALIGQGVQQFMGGADACGCPPKPFVRLDKCGRPIITRAMQKKAKEMVMCMGIEGAAQALGVPVPLLAEIAFKQFKPRAKGISGAQLRNAKRVNRAIINTAKSMGYKCTPMANAFK